MKETLYYRNSKFEPEAKIMKTKTLLLFLLFLAAVFAGCKKPKNELLGTWQINSGGTIVYFTFQENNDLNVNNEVFTKYFITEDHKLIIGREDPVQFSVRNNTLRIMQEGTILTYTRVQQNP
jgi:hypothetical protein